MLCKCVLGSGIKNKQAIEITKHNGYKIFYLKEWGEDQLKFILFDNHLFPATYDIEKIKEVLDKTTDFKQALINEFEYWITQGRGVSTGLGQYLNREDDVIKSKEEQAKKRQEEIDQRKRLEVEKEQREQEQYEQELIQAEEKFKNGEFISGYLFLGLCDKYEITLPLRTLGWCQKQLIKISQNQYQFKGGKGKNGSTVVFNYVKILNEKIV